MGLGLPNQKLIPPNFQADWAPTIADTMMSVVRVTRLGNPQGVRDPDTGRTTFPTPWIVHEGPARIQSRGTGVVQGGTTTVADRTLTIGSSMVALPADSEPALVGDTVKVLSCPDTPWLVGKTLAVVEISAADVAFQRSLGCNLHEPTIKG